LHMFCFFNAYIYKFCHKIELQSSCKFHWYFFIFSVIHLSFLFYFVFKPWYSVLYLTQCAGEAFNWIFLCELWSFYFQSFNLFRFPQVFYIFLEFPFLFNLAICLHLPWVHSVICLYPFWVHWLLFAFSLNSFSCSFVFSLILFYCLYIHSFICLIILIILLSR
jgi:hypothetical protein